jgi:phenylacetate-CoA ligase
MSDSRFWHPRHETAPRAEIEALQVRKLRRLIGRTLAAEGLQAKLLVEAGVDEDAVRSLDDLRRLPLLTRTAIMSSQIASPPFGEVLAGPVDAAVRCHLSSGTTGRTPLRVLDSLTDWEWIAESWCYGFWGFGVRPHDRVFFAFGYGGFIGFWGAHYACEKIGCLVIPGGSMTTEARVRQILDLGITVVCSTPTYALRMAQEAEALGLDLPGSAVSRLILSGEPAGSIPATKRLIEQQWGAQAGDTAGMTELGTIMMFECDAQPGGAHIIEDHFIEEVIDPHSGEPAAMGELGERVVTSFGRTLIPLIRYRTGDLVMRVPGATCPCGRTWDIYDGGIRGRIDDMKIVRGTNVYPRAVEAVVREHAEVGEFQIHLYTADGIRDEIEVLVEVPASGDVDVPALLDSLGHGLSEIAEGLRFGVREVPIGTLPRFELKARRTNDERTVVGGVGLRELIS